MGGTVGGRILFVDDDATCRAAFMELTMPSGYVVDVVGDAREALALAATADYSVLATDYRMPNMSGVDLLREMQRTNPNASCVLVTGFGTEALNAAGDSGQAISSVILKPWDRDELTEALRTAIDIHERRLKADADDVVRILAVEDNPGDATLLFELLRNHQQTYETHLVNRLAAAVVEVDQSLFHVAVVDLSLPDATGLDVVRQLHHRAPNLPIIVLTSLDDDAIAGQALQSGAQDYLVKGTLDSELLARTIRYAIERKRAEKKLVDLLHKDPLTGLGNRTSLDERLEAAMARAKRTGEQFALLLLDLDRFKSINDTLGHQAGDAVLRRVGARLKAQSRSEDTLVRLGGDEFALLIEGISHPREAVAAASRAAEILRRPLTLAQGEVRVTGSIGIAVFPSDATTATELLRIADLTMYQAKDLGRNAFALHSELAHNIVVRELALERDLLKAIETKEIELWYQPQYDVRTRTLYGVEALARWRHPQLGQVGPEEFIPLLERTGLIRDWGEWALRVACAQLGDNCALHSLAQISVNVSARQLDDSALVATVKELLLETGLPGDRLELEVTESVVMRDLPHAVNVLTRLRDLGVAVALDDFGTGYSSFAHLQHLPLNTLKLDGAFIKDLGHEATDATLVRSIVHIAHHLGLKVVAEAVETRAQLDTLAEIGCDRVQGFWCGRPTPIGALAGVASRLPYM